MDAIARDLAAVARIAAVPTILKTIRQTTGLRFTLVARVMRDRWIACAVHDEIGFGLKVGNELDVATTLCSQVRDGLEPVVIDCASTDPQYCAHPTPKLYGFESYVSVPIFRRTGDYFGTLCGLDPVPRVLNDDKTVATLKLFSELISLQLEADELHEGDRVELDAEREVSRQREEFIAVLGHDLRNPLSSISAGALLLLGRTADEGDRRTLQRVASSACRIAALVDDVLDLARGQLGGGIALEMATADDLGPRLRHVAEELRSSHPGRCIDVRFGFDGPLRCDARRIEQVLSNLLANALEHGYRDAPVLASVDGDASRFVIEVENRGVPIPRAAIARVFQPYFRVEQHGRGGGLGLGLYIVFQVAKAHGGTVDVDSSGERTVFRFAMPRAA
jgi:signal transduction histidine kinase